MIINLTLNVLTILDDSRNSVLISQPSGQVAQVLRNNKPTPAGELDGVPLFNVPYIITGLPQPQPNTIYIVPSAVVAAAPQRKDLFHVGRLVNDSDYIPLGYLGLVR